MCVYSSSLQLRKLSKEGKNRLSSCLASSFLLFWQIERFKTPRMWKSASTFQLFKKAFQLPYVRKYFFFFLMEESPGSALRSMPRSRLRERAKGLRGEASPKPFPFCPPPLSLYPTHDPYMRHWKEGLGTHLPSPIKKTL